MFPVKAEMVIKLPETIDLDQAALVEPVAVAAHAIRRAGGVEGKNIVVLGAGTIGNLIALVALTSGSTQVLITDVREYKLDKAPSCGMEYVFDTTKENLGKAIVNTFGANKADLIFECVGVQTTITQAVESARKGSTIVVVSVFGKKQEVDLGLVQDREMSLVGTDLPPRVGPVFKW